MASKIALILLPLLLSLQSASAILYSQYILAPTSKTVLPRTVYGSNGSIKNVNKLLSQGSTSFTGENASVTLDFGREIGGNVNFNVDSLDGISHMLAFTFTESSQWISPDHCDAILGSRGVDPPLAFNISRAGYYASNKDIFRGGFRYLTIVSNSANTITISNLTVNFNAEPTMSNPAAYTGYFNCNDEKLNRVWYAGAYTNQMCTIDPTQGNALGGGFNISTIISNGTSVLVDGAKRARLVWPGDIVVSGPSLYVSTGNFDGVKNALDSLLILQQSNGQLPYAGSPYQQQKSTSTFLWSFTYHLHTLIVMYDYYIFTGDLAYLNQTWDQFKLALNYIVSTIDSSGLAYVNSENDWGRRGMGAHNIEANSILFYTLGLGLYLASEVGDTTVAASWTSSRTGIQDAVVPLLWDKDLGLFKDKEGSARIPQDGNAWAVISGLVNSSISSTISSSLAARWIRPYGAPAPEGGDVISPFTSGFELRAHYLAGHASRAVDLMSFMWADFMLDDPRMTNSTFLEGYSTDGSIRWAPYSTADAKISYAHGWSSAPTSVLTNLGVGIQLTGPAGRTWVMKPQLGGLSNITAGFTTSLGAFSASYTEGGRIGAFHTPIGTEGSFIFSFAGVYSRLELQGPTGKLVSYNKSNNAVINNLPGGAYSVWFS